MPTRFLPLYCSLPPQASSPAPIFGASATFGGTGFGGFGAVAAAAPKAEGEGDAEGGDEEEVGAGGCWGLGAGGWVDGRGRGVRGGVHVISTLRTVPHPTP